MTDEYRDLLDTETILPGDEYRSWDGCWYEVKGSVYYTPRELRGGKYRRPILAKPEPPSEPASEPRWYTLRGDEIISPGDQYDAGDGVWCNCWLSVGDLVVNAMKKQHFVAVRRWGRPSIRPLAVSPAHRAYIHRHPSPDADVLPSMRYAIVCPDGVRRHAATWDEAVAVFDDAVRRECERKGE